jgi:hypothetical protein
VPGKSAFDVHERLNINRNGCPFPAGYGGAAPSPSPAPSAVTSGPITADSAYPGYSLATVDDGVINASGGTVSTFASGDSGDPHFILFKFSEAKQVNEVTIHWAFNPILQQYMVSREVDIQYWNGSAFQTITSIKPADLNVLSSTANFSTVMTSQIRFYQPANQGPSVYPGVFWVTEIDYGLAPVPGPVVDTILPTVTITSPVNGAVVKR